MRSINYEKIAKRAMKEKIEAVLLKEKPWAEITFESIHEDWNEKNGYLLVGIIEYNDCREDSNMVKPFDIVIPEYGEVKIIGYKDVDIPYNGYNGNYPLWYDVDSEKTIDKDTLRREFAKFITEDEDGEFDDITLNEWINEIEEIDKIRRIW